MKAIASFLLSLGATIAMAFVATFFWRWFAVPALHVQPITLATALGLMTLAKIPSLTTTAMTWVRIDNAGKNPGFRERQTAQLIMNTVVFVFVAPLILGTGWLWHWAMLAGW
jgi:hypothetical protein